MARHVNYAFLDPYPGDDLHERGVFAPLKELVEVKKVRDKMTPAIEMKVEDVLDEWFGPEYSVSDAKA